MGREPHPDGKDVDALLWWCIGVAATVVGLAYAAHKSGLLKLLF